MKRFKYQAKDDRGNVVSGEVEATTQQQAAKLVRQKGFVVISITPKRELPLEFIVNFRNRVSGGDVSNFTRQLATMINAGLPVTEALLILRSQVKGTMQRVVAEILANVEEGQALSAALSKHRNVFSNTYIALMKSGEVGGVLDEVLVKLADDLEKREEFRGKVKGALIYPVIIIVGMVIVALIMLIFVIPRVTALYEQFDTELPLMTKIVIGTSDFMIKFWPLVVISIGAAVYGFKFYRSTKEGRRKVDEIFTKLPILGPLQKQIILTDLTRTLSLMISSGVSILESLSIASQVVTNVVVAEALSDIYKLVEKGFPLAFAFARHPEAFPIILSQMIAVGEETGKMDEVLLKVSHVFEVESEQKIKALTAAIEPMILIVMGVGVAFLVVAIIMPIYNLTTKL